MSKICTAQKKLELTKKRLKDKASSFMKIKKIDINIVKEKLKTKKAFNV